MAPSQITAIFCASLFLAHYDVHAVRIADAHRFSRLLHDSRSTLTESSKLISRYSRRRLQASDPTDAEIAYCFPYYFIYQMTGNAFNQCATIVRGAVKGSGNVKDECLLTLLPVYSTFTSAQMETAISNYNKCLFRNGYTITKAAADEIASSTVPAITKRVTGTTSTPSNSNTPSGTTSTTSSSGGGITNTPTTILNNQNAFNNNLNQQTNTNTFMNNMANLYSNSGK